MGEPHRIEHAKASEFLATVETDSVDLILTDPPYFRVKAMEWDRAWSDADRFIAWLGTIADEWARVLKSNGALVCFAGSNAAAANGATLAARVEVMIAERLNVVASPVWVKADAQGNGKHSVQDRSGLRSYFPQTERAIMAEHTEQPWQRQIRAAMMDAHVGTTDLARMVGCDSRLVHGWLAGDRLPHGRFLKSLEAWLGTPLTGKRPFRAERGQHHTDVWTYPTVAPRDGKHPCEKPEAMALDLVRQCSRPGGVVLDTFAGSGVFLAAAASLGRVAIGCDADEHWVGETRERVRLALPVDDLDPVKRIPVESPQLGLFE